MNKFLFGTISLLLGIAVVILVLNYPLARNDEDNQPKAITNFKECVESGNPVQESFPRKCSSGGQTFTEDLDRLETANVRVFTPVKNQIVSSPLVILGEARGNWFFEASFPITIQDDAGRELGQGIAQAKGEWMTTDFVLFEATLTFSPPSPDTGTLILHKDNPSGLPENDDRVEMPLRFR